MKMSKNLLKIWEYLIPSGQNRQKVQFLLIRHSNYNFARGRNFFNNSMKNKAIITKFLDN